MILTRAQISRGSPDSGTDLTKADGGCLAAIDCMIRLRMDVII